MVRSSQKTLFVTLQAVTLIPNLLNLPPESDLPLAASVIPALWALQKGGFRLVLLGGVGMDEATLRNHLPMRLLASQGVVWDDVVPAFQRSDWDPKGTFEPQLFASLRDAIGRQQIDVEQTAVIGWNDEARGFAEVMGFTYWGIESQVTWLDLVHQILHGKRKGSVTRRTRETEIHVELVLGGHPAQSRIKTGLGYFDHMLDQLARHGGMELTVLVTGDLHVDDHHTVEDTGLALGEALRQALGDRRGIQRYGFTLPMDETLAQCALDLSGRPAFVFKGRFAREKVGELATEMVPHFFQSLGQTLGAAIHLSVEGENAHHQVEGLFKAFARSLMMAAQDTGDGSVPSTKGVL